MANLADLDNPAVFFPELAGCVHKDCSPWTSQEIETAYAKSKTFRLRMGTSAPFSGAELHDGTRPFYDAFCNVCLENMTITDSVMLVPVTLEELKFSVRRASAYKAMPEPLECDCPAIFAAGCQNPLHL